MLDQMSPTELLERVASALGWKHLFTDANGRTEGMPPGASKRTSLLTKVPAYTSDIGLAHKACQTLMDTGTRCMLWHAFLYRAVSQDGTHCHGSVVLHATPARYCHAALEVLDYHNQLCRDQAAVDRTAADLASAPTKGSKVSRPRGGKEKR